MRLFLFSLLLVLTSLPALANYLDIKAPATLLRAGESHAFKAYYYDAEGKVFDVTSLTTFQSNYGINRGLGLFYFEPTMGQFPMSTNVRASFKAQDGQVYSDEVMINLDSTPHYLQIFGPAVVWRNSSAFFTAFAQYRETRRNITNECFWTAFNGMISAGFYRPSMFGGIFSDTITCRIGNSFQSHFISIQ